MKRYLLLVAVVMTLVSCKNTWDDDDKNTFYQACMDAAKGDGYNEVKAKPYCDCLMDKMMEKYPNEADALDHMDVISTDKDLQKCKEQLKN